MEEAMKGRQFPCVQNMFSVALCSVSSHQSHACKYEFGKKKRQWPNQQNSARLRRRRISLLSLSILSRGQHAIGFLGSAHSPAFKTMSYACHQVLSGEVANIYVKTSHPMLVLSSQQWQSDGDAATECLRASHTLALRVNASHAPCMGDYLADYMLD